MLAGMAGPPPADSTTDAAGNRPPRRRRGRWLRWIAGLLVVLALLIVAVWSARVPLAQWGIETIAARFGYGALSLTVTRLDLDGAAARDVRLGGLSAATITLAYDVSGLLGGQLAATEIDGLRLDGQLGASGLVIDGLTLPTADPAAPLTIPALPIARIAVTDATAALATGAGPARLAFALDAAQATDASFDLTGELDATLPDGTAKSAFNGRIGPGQPDGIAATFDIATTGGVQDTSFDLAGDLTATLGADRAGRISLVLRDGTLRHPQATVEGLSGDGTLAIGAGPLAIDARLAFATASVGDFELAPSTVQVALDGGRARATAELAAAEGRATLALETRLDDPAAPLAVRFDGTVLAQALERVPGVSANDGVVQVAASGVLPPLARLAEPRTPADWLAATTFSGTADVDLRGLAIAGAVDAADAAGPLRFETAARQVLVDGRDAFRLENVTLAPALREQLPAAVAPFAESLALRLDAPALAVRLTADGADARLVTTAALAAGDATVVSEIDATVALDAAWRPQRLAAPYASLRASDLPVGDLRLDVDALATDVQADIVGAEPRLGADLSLVASADGFALPGLELAPPRVDLTARVELDRDRLVLRPAAGSRVVVAGLGLRDRIALPRGMTLTLAGDAGWLMVDLAQRRLTYDLALAPLALDAVVLLPGGRTAATSLVLPDPRLTGDGRRHGARVTGGRLSVADPALAGSSVELAAVWADGVLDADLRIARLAAGGTPAPVAPVGAALGLRLADDVVSFAASVAAPLGPIDLRIAGHHDLARATGRADVAMTPLTFVSGGVQPVDLAPALGDRLRDVVGTLALDGTLDWTDVALTPALRLSFDGLGAVGDAGRIEGLRGDIAVSGLVPPATPPGQRLTGRVVLKKTVMPLTLDFQARPDGRLAIERLRMDAAGGTVELRDTVFDPTDPDIAATLELSDIDLGLLLAQLGVDGLSGSGRLSGAIPMRLVDGRMAIDAGRLAAAGGGQLSYTGAGLSEALGSRDDTVGLAARALSDIRYKELAIELQKSAAGPGTLRLNVTGANPAVLDGYPFRLNIVLDADFDRLALLLLEGLAAADDILRKAALRLQR